MKTSMQLIGQIIRAKTALHLKLVAQRKDGKVDIGGGRIDDLLAEVDAGLSSYERMLVRYKNEIAAAVMASSTDAESAPPEFIERGPRRPSRRPDVERSADPKAELQ
jgi:hypothetical protein